MKRKEKNFLVQFDAHKNPTMFHVYVAVKGKDYYLMLTCRVFRARTANKKFSGKPLGLPIKSANI